MVKRPIRIGVIYPFINQYKEKPSMMKNQAYKFLLLIFAYTLWDRKYNMIYIVIPFICNDTADWRKLDKYRKTVRSIQSV